MAKFIYQARNAAGQSVSGTVEAKQRESVAEILLEKGLVPVEITEKKTVFSLKQLTHLEILPQKVKTEDMLLLCRQMYTMIKAGVPLLDSLAMLIDTLRNATLNRTLSALRDRITAGQTLSQSAQHFPKVFPPVFISVVDAGEQSGQLEEAFFRLALHFEQEAKMQKRVKSATRYPMIVIVALILAFGVINFMVIPAFVDMFKSFKAELPLVTRIMMATSQFLTNNWLVMLIVVIVLVVGWRYYLKTPGGRYQWDRAILKAPIFGSIINRVIIARFARIFTMTVKSGVPMVDGIHLVAYTLGNSYVSALIVAMAEKVSRGETLAKASEETTVFSPIALQMISVGENTGALEAMLEEVADYYEREVDYDLDRLGDLIEPVLLVLMGIMVLIMALGIFLPMWDMTSFIRK